MTVLRLPTTATSAVGTGAIPARTAAGTTTRISITGVAAATKTIT